VLHHVHASGHIADSSLAINSYLFMTFFVLSGFVIFGSYGARLQRGYSITHFMFLRFFRLYPTHLFMLLLFLLNAVSLGPQTFSDAGQSLLTSEWREKLHSLGLTALLANSFTAIADNPWNAPSWSISA
jgi:peptidoglycan/LPS O-acetylase OafA/YrhL